MSVVKKLVGESKSGVRLEAVIVKNDGAPYSIRYYVDNNFKTEIVCHDESLALVEKHAEEWLGGIEPLNG